MSDAYQGDEFMGYAPFINFIGPTYVVAVSGAKWNPCGHMLLNTGGIGGWYFHICERKGYPHHMDQAGYERYLLENRKIEIYRRYVPISNPTAAKRKLTELLNQKWRWFVLPNNCVHFVEEVVQAGGANFGLYSNCPAIEDPK